MMPLPMIRHGRRDLAACLGLEENEEAFRDRSGNGLRIQLTVPSLAILIAMLAHHRV
jgi:hypothetical protein